jgi:hypothetical protein
LPGGIGFLVISNYVKVFILFPQVNVKNIFIPALKVLIVTCAHVTEATLGAHPRKEEDKKVGIYIPQVRGGGTRSANERADSLPLGHPQGTGRADVAISAHAIVGWIPTAPGVDKKPEIHPDRQQLNRENHTIAGNYFFSLQLKKKVYRFVMFYIIIYRS